MRSLPFLLARFFGTPFRWLLGIFRSKVHGDARWMTRAEMRRFLNPQYTGLVISPEHRLSQQDSFKNLALIAPTGSGKTTRYVIPNIFHAEGSVVVTDPSGEIYAATSKQLRERSFGIQVLQPANLNESLRFNPLVYWRKPQELRQLATILAQNMASENSDPFWSTSATNVLFLSLSALVNVADKKFITLANLRWVLNGLGTNDRHIETFMARHLEQRDPKVFSEYLAFCAMDAKIQGSILSTARAAVELWTDPDVCRFTESNTVNIAALRQKRTAIFVIVPEH